MNPGGDRLGIGPDEEFLDPPPANRRPSIPAANVRLGDREAAGSRTGAMPGPPVRASGWRSASSASSPRSTRSSSPPGGYRTCGRPDAQRWRCSRSAPTPRGSGCGASRRSRRGRDVDPPRAAVGRHPARRRADRSFAVEAGCAVLHAGGPRRTLAFGESDTRSRLLHLVEAGADRSLLLVKEAIGGEPADLACTTGGEGPCTGLRLDSLAVGGATGRHRLAWRLVLYAVCGRTSRSGHCCGGSSHRDRFRQDQRGPDPRDPGIAYGLAAYDPGDGHVDAAEVARTLGVPADELFKTLVARTTRADQGLLRAGRRDLSLKKAARASRVGRSSSFP